MRNKAKIDKILTNLIKGMKSEDLDLRIKHLNKVISQTEALEEAAYLIRFRSRGNRVSYIKKLRDMRDQAKRSLNIHS